MNAIQLAGVTKVDSGETVLNSVSLSIPMGGVLGDNRIWPFRFSGALTCIWYGSA